MEKRWTWRPKDQRVAQNEEILNAVARGEARSEIAARLEVTPNTVNGVVARAKAAGDPRAAVPSVRMAHRAARLARLARQAAKEN